MRRNRSIGLLLACLLTLPLLSRHDAAAQFGGGGGGAQAQGVYVDADGVLHAVMVGEKGDQLARLRRQNIARATGAVAGKAPLRSVSLTRAAKEVRACIEAGRPVPDELRHLAGITQIQYVFVYPEEKDIVISGPAEGWEMDAAGRVVGVSSKRPVVRLDDLVVALRTFPPGGNRNTVVGCSIDQTQEGMQRLNQYLASVGTLSNRNGVPALLRGVRESLGMHDIVVWGVPGDSRLAMVLVEADYRMKLIGLGLENPRVRSLTSFYSLLGPGDAGRLKVQHWWFVPSYDAIVTSDDRTAFEFRGQRVKLVGADDRPTAGGEVEKGTKSGGNTQKFAQSFTAHYEELARINPIFADLQNAFDLIILAALIQQDNLLTRVAPDVEYLLDTAGFQPERFPTPKNVDSVVNAKWLGSKLATPVGGVVVEPPSIISSQSGKPTADSKLEDRRHAARSATAGDRWWTD
jgi:hypothetical protein